MFFCEEGFGEPPIPGPGLHSLSPDHNHPVTRGGRIIKALQNLDAGSEYMLGGRWLPEDHPLVLAELRRMRTM